MTASDPIIRRALLSVSDKRDLVPFARALADRGIELISTGGSARQLAEAGVAVQDVARVTGFPEILDGRVKTLHPSIHGGILARRDMASHQDALLAHDVPTIDLVVVNLYPFENTVAGGGDFAACIENIDIGGPALIRAAAKNHAFVTVVTDPADYQTVLDELTARGGAISADLRRLLAAAAYARTAAYDAAVSGWFSAQVGEPFPRHVAFGGSRRQDLRYGENPHQRAAFYVSDRAQPSVATAEQVQGKELSYNNINDTDAAFALAAEFEQPATVIVKHANPCGVAIGATLADAYARAHACDPVSAFGGIVAVNRPLDGATAAAITGIFTEVVIAPAADDNARAVFAEKKNLRLLLTGSMPDPAVATVVKAVAGGLLVQDGDHHRLAHDDLRVVSKRAPTDAEIETMRFAFTVCKHVKSNAIVFARDGATVGIGAGQMSRVDSTRIAALKAADAASAAGETGARTRDSVVASDAFFPFADGLIAAADAGATAIIQPGGSVRDDEVIAAADARDIAMVFTGVRHFRH